MSWYEQKNSITGKAKKHQEIAINHSFKNTLRTPLSEYQEAKKYKDINDFMKSQGILVYHGSPEKFDIFDVEMAGKSTDSGMFGRGIYFTDDIKEAETYSVRNGKKGEVKEVYINLKNPYIINKTSDIPDIKVPDTTMDDLKNADKNYSRMFTEHLQRQGYDGVIDNLSSTKQYVVFEISQIKTKQQLIDTWNNTNKKV